MFEVDDYKNYVKVQTEAALRNLATSYTYDAHDDGADVAARPHRRRSPSTCKTEIQERLARAGVEVMEARISHLAYAPEIAQAMLQRQQAGAIIAARQRIVEGAVGHGGDGARDAVAGATSSTLDNERKAAMVSNLLVVLCGDRVDPADHQHRHDLSVERRVAERKPFLLRIDRDVLDAVQRWADDELRSLNGQIEFLLRRALKEEGESREVEEEDLTRGSTRTLRIRFLRAAAGGSRDAAPRDDRRAADRERAA